jgi:hypothetical protein
MKRVDVLNTYRLIMMFVHLFFAHWIIDIWGFRLKTFLFLTKINFFTNFVYFFYTGIILNYISYKINTEEKFQTPENLQKFREQVNISNKIFKFSFCLSVVVVFLYWSLFLFAPSMLGDTPTPFVLELFLHGGNMAVLFMDAIFNSKENKEKNSISYAFFIKFTILYFMVKYFVYYTWNIQVYPMISKLSVPQYSMIGAAGYGLFLIGHVFHDKVLLSF